MDSKIALHDTSSGKYTLLYAYNGRSSSEDTEKPLFVDESRINLLDTSTFCCASNWRLSDNTNESASISNDVRGFERINKNIILSLYSKGNSEHVNAISHNSIPLRPNNYYSFSIYAATHRATGAVFIELLDDVKSVVRNIALEITSDILGGERLDLYRKLSTKFCPSKKEKYLRIRYTKGPALYGEDSFMFLVLPHLSIISFSSDEGSVTIDPELRSFMLKAVADGKPLAIARIGREEISTNPDGSAQVYDREQGAYNSLKVLSISAGDVVPTTPENPTLFYTKRHMISRNKVKIIVGTILYNNSKTEMNNLTRQSAISVSFLKNMFASQNIDVEVESIYLDNSPDKSKSLTEMADWTRIPSSINLGFARGHNLLMNYAFDEISNADYYIMVNPDGFPIQDCYFEMVNMAVFQHDAGLVEAVQFPIEHPKTYDPVTYETSWCSGACLLISKKAFEETRGFDENFTMYCEDVDLSWRVREADLSTKVCRSATFYHDVRDRSDKSVRRSMLISGRYLGHKWGAPTFVNWVNDLLVSEGFYPDKIYIPELKQNAVIRDPAVGEFRQGFYFAVPRW